MAGLGWRDYEAVGEEIETLYGQTAKPVQQDSPFNAFWKENASQLNSSLWKHLSSLTFSRLAAWLRAPMRFWLPLQASE